MRRRDMCAHGTSVEMKKRRFAQARGLDEPPFYPSAPDRRHAGCAHRRGAASTRPAYATLSATR
ncbi:hypothetical protein P355_1059 [Burkholderia cenocepacia KC-01]|nr:hypothetical protein P355_1059 [Burkholderia cenocepacia KC-01]